LRFRKPLLILAIIILVSGLLLFAVSTVRETHTSTQSSWYNAPAQAGTFSYGGATLPLGNSRQTIIGTSGIADLIILAMPYQNFSDWVCHFVPSYDTYSRCVRFGGDRLNVTILYSYLQTHQSQIAYSQTIVDENITLDSIAYHVINPTDVTLILAYLGSGWVREYGRTTVSNETISYPLIGYTERPGTSWTLPNISLGLIISGIAGIVAVALLWSRFEPPRTTAAYQGTTMQACPHCGGENLFFAKKCQHCGRTLHEEMPKAELVSH
jgi:hypothetical protein